MHDTEPSIGSHTWYIR